jgi:hypothetical protein
VTTPSAARTLLRLARRYAHDLAASARAALTAARADPERTIAAMAAVAGGLLLVLPAQWRHDPAAAALLTAAARQAVNLTRLARRALAWAHVAGPA